MRDITVTILVIIGLFYTIKKPYLGILLWSWLGYMNPHRLCYGFAYTMPFAQITAIVTMVAIMFSNERKALPKDFLVYLLLFFIGWMGLTTYFAFNENGAYTLYIKILKIQLPIFLTLMLFNTKERIMQLLWVIVISLGYFSTKGGVFTLLTAGSFRVYGPPNSFVEENNALAVASLMVVPLMIFLRKQLTKPWQKQLMLFAIVSTGFSIIGSQSRGAVLAILTVGSYFWFQSERKVASGFMILIFIAFLAVVLPETWYERMNTINTYDKDSSAMGRLDAWKMAINVANDNIFGGGLKLWKKSTYLQYLPGYNPSHKAFVAHSIYFSVIGEHGWIGFFLFGLLFFLGWKNCNILIKQCTHQVQLQWISDLAKMMKVGLLAYFAGGAFLSLAYFDLPWHYLAITVLLKEIANNTEPIPEERLAEDKVMQKKPPVKLNEQGYIQ